MPTTTDLFNNRIIDNQTGKVVTATSLVNRGNWQFIQLGNHTSAAPLNVLQGTTQVIDFQPQDISYSAGNVSDVAYDYINQLFRPTILNDLYAGEIRFKARCSIQNGHGDIRMDVPNFAYNPVHANTIGIPKGAGVEQFISSNGLFFVGEEMLEEGFQISFSAGDGGFEIYDVSFLWCRIASGL